MNSHPLSLRVGSGIAVAAIAAFLLAAPLAARAQGPVAITMAPPAPRYEPAPSPRSGYVWAPGHWQWAGGRYNWSGGYWMRARPGYHWVPGGWNHRGPNWTYAPGGWVR